MAIQKSIITQSGASAQHHHVGRITIDLMADPPTLSVWLVSYYDAHSYYAGKGKMGDTEHRVELGTEPGQFSMPVRADLMRHIHRYLLTLPEWEGGQAVGPADEVTEPALPAAPPKRQRTS